MSSDKENQDPNAAYEDKLDFGTPTSPTKPAEAVEEGPPKDPKLRRSILPNPIVDDFKDSVSKSGVLIPLKTTQEVRQDHTIVQALITRAPTKIANNVLSYVMPSSTVLSPQ